MLHLRSTRHPRAATTSAGNSTRCFVAATSSLIVSKRDHLRLGGQVQRSIPVVAGLPGSMSTQFSYKSAGFSMGSVRFLGYVRVSVGWHVLAQVESPWRPEARRRAWQLVYLFNHAHRRKLKACHPSRSSVFSDGIGRDFADRRPSACDGRCPRSGYGIKFSLPPHSSQSAKNASSNPSRISVNLTLRSFALQRLGVRYYAYVTKHIPGQFCFQNDSCSSVLSVVFNRVLHENVGPLWCVQNSPLGGARPGRAKPQAENNVNEKYSTFRLTADG